MPSAITTDGTLGTTVTQNGRVYTITGGTQPGNGPNLFHSFGRFSIGTNDTARFTGPQTGIENILSRVTGGEQSIIDGLLQSEFPGANLYLLNPSGVVFGPNARLDVNGSFHVSTADVLRFEDGSTFATAVGEKSTLTVAAPAAFGFLREHPAGIAVQESTLEVPPGRAVAVVGGDIAIVGGTLRAPHGRVSIASVASPGEVMFSSLNLPPDLQVNSVTRLGRLELSQSALLDASGVGVSGTGGPGGTILIRSGRLLVDGSSMLANTLGDDHGASVGLDLQVTADAVMTNDAVLRASPQGAGNGGNIMVQVGQLTLTGGARIDTNTLGSGRGGDLRVTATEAMTIAGQNGVGNPSAFFSNTFGSGDTGHVAISTPVLVMDGGRIQAAVDGRGSGHARGLTIEVGRLALTGGAQVDSSTYGRGRGGDLRVTATEAMTITGRDSAGFRSGLYSNSNGSGDAGSLVVSAPVLIMNSGRIDTHTLGDGNAGNIDVQVGRLELTGGAQIFSGAGQVVVVNGVPTFEGTGGPGRGGALTISATDTIVITGQDPIEGFQSGLFSNAHKGTGRAGELFVTAPSVTMQGGRILASTESASSGDAGNLTLEVGRLTLMDGAQISSSTSGAGRGSDVMITATGMVTIAGQDSGVFNSTLSSRDAGRIVLSTPTLEMRDGAVIDSSTINTGQGGSISIRATDTVSIRGTANDSLQSVIASSAFSSGDAGGIVIAAPTLEMIGGSIVAATVGNGKGGTITLEVDRLTLADNALISASTAPFPLFGLNQTGQAGNIIITATDFVAISGRDGKISGIDSSTASRGNAGSIEINTGRLALTGSAIISSGSLGPGQGGKVRINVSGSVEMNGGTISVRTLADGKAGDLVIETGRMSLANGAQITGDTSGAGVGGDITITATNGILLASGSDMSTETSGQAAAGTITLRAPDVQVTGESTRIDAETRGMRAGGSIQIEVDRLMLTEGAQISTSTRGPGPGGTLTVTAQESINIIDRVGGSFRSGLFSNSGEGDAIAGDAGDIVLTASRLTIDGGRILARTLGDGNAGNITVPVGRLELLGGAQIFNGIGNAQRSGEILGNPDGAGHGGNLMVSATESIVIAGQDREGFLSGLFSNAQIGTGRAGDLLVTTPRLEIREGGSIGVNTFGSGAGGDIVLTASTIELSHGAVIAAKSTGAGNAGSIRLTATDILLREDSTVTTEAIQASGGNMQITRSENGAAAEQCHYCHSRGRTRNRWG